MKKLYNLRYFVLIVMLAMLVVNASAQLYWNNNGVAAPWTSSNWSTINSAPFTTPWTNNTNTIFFANSTVNWVTNTQIGNITVNGTTTTVTFVPTGTLSTNGNIRTIDVASGCLLDFGGQDVSTAAGTGFVKNGLGTWSIGTQSKQYNGGFTLNAGTVIVSGNNSFGNSGVLTINGGTIQSSGAKTYANNIIIGGDFVLSGSGNATHSGTVDLGAATRTITNAASGSRSFSGGISGAAGSGIIFNGGTTILSGASNYSGSTSINNGILQLSTANDRLPSGTTVNLGQSSSPNVGTLDLSGQSQQIAGLNSITGTNTTNSSNTVNSTTAATLTLGGSGTYNYGDGTKANSGVITGLISIVKNGSGFQTLGDGNTYTGLTTISNGTLQLNKPNGTTIPITNDVTINGGVLKVSSNQTINNLNLSSGMLTIDAGKTLTITGTYNASGGIINNLGTLKFSGGAVTFPGLGVIVNNGAANTLTNLEIALTTGDVTLSSSLTISNTLTLSSGTFAVGSNTLSLNGSAIAGTPANLSTTIASSLAFGGSSSNVVVPVSVAALNGLTINNTKGVSLSGNVVIGGTLTLTSGNLTVGSNTLTLNGPAIVGVPANLITTSSSSLSFGGSSSGVSIPSSVIALNGLVINNANGINLNSSPVISGVLKFILGNIITDNNKVIISQTSSITGAGASTGWVAGNLQKYVTTVTLKVTFEIGDALNYREVVVDFESVSGPGNLTAGVTQTDGIHPSLNGSGIDATKSLKRYFTLLKSGINFTKLTATFNYIPADINGTGLNYEVRQYNGSVWTAPSSSSSNGSSTKGIDINSLNNTTNDFAIGEPLSLIVTTAASSTSVCDGGTATFTAASTSSPSPTIQWKVNSGGGYDIITNNAIYSGATSNTLTITGVTTAMSGYNYRATFTNINGSKSSAATLIVNPLPAAPTIFVSQPCNGSTTGTVTITAPTGSGYSYSMDGSNYINTTAFSLTPGTYPITDKNSDGCISSITSATVNTPANYWTGNTSSDWNVAANWSCGVVPTSTDNAVIPATTNKPALTAATTIADLNIASGTGITVGFNTFTINGTVSGTGVLTGSTASKLVVGGSGGSGTLYFNQADSITNSLDSFAVTRVTGNIGIGNKLNLLNVLNISGGGILNTNDNLVLRSTDSTKTARVAPVSGFINGDVTVERYMSKRRSYRFVTPSVITNQSIRTAWMEGQNNTSTTVNSNTKPGYGTHISGSGGASNGFDQTVTNSASLFVWNNVSGGYSAVTNVSGSGGLTAGKGYRLFIRGSRSVDLSNNDAAPSATILRATGTLITGPVTFNTTSTVPLSGSALGYSFIGNPYASPVRWSALAKTNVSATYYAYDPTVNSRGAFISYNSFTGSNNTSSRVNDSIQSGQAFFVQTNTTSSNTSIVFQESSKTAGNTVVFRNTGASGILSVKLLLTTALGSQNTADGTKAIFDDTYSSRIGQEDSYKLNNQDENIAINHNDTSLSIEGRPFAGETDTVYLRLWQYRQKDYFLRLDAANFIPGTTAFVKDAYLNIEAPVNISDSTLVPFSITADSASFAPDRFIVVFKPGSVLPVTVTDLKAYQKDKGIQVDWISRTETNVVRYEIEKSVDGREFVKVGSVGVKGNNASAISYSWFDTDPVEGSNFYRIKVIEKTGLVKYTQIVKVITGKSNSNISVYPNPVKGNAVSLHLTNMQKGKYTVNLHNNLGQKIMSRQIEHIGSSGNYTISIEKVMPKGSYRLTVSNGETDMSTTVIFE